MQRIKKNDLVVVISGKDKGKKGAVIAIDPKIGMVKVKGVAMATVHKKPKMANQRGKVVHEERFIHECKVMPVCPSTKKPCRVRTKVLAEGKKVRVSHRSQEVLDN